MDTLDKPLSAVRKPETLHTYYVRPQLKAVLDSKTGKIEVKAFLGIAPDSHTIIEYPVHVWSSGYWNRATTRKVMGVVKAQFLAECQEIGYNKKNFTEPLEITTFWE